MKIWKWEYNGFHGAANCSVRVPEDAQAGDKINLSTRQAQRLDALVCSGGDCLCCERITQDDGGNCAPYIILPVMSTEMRGHYPQSV